MILVLCAVLLLIRALYSLAEIYFERDWPHHTWRGLALSLILFVFCISIFA
jgi:hypothetical protein